MSDAPSDFEQTIRSAWEARDFEAAATLALQGYGSEIIDFLSARLRSSSDGQEAFSMFAEDLWNGLPGFAWRCSLRTWAYTVARNAANRYATSPHNRRTRHLALASPSRVSVLVERVRSATQAHQRTDIKDKFRALRDRLDQDDQMVLILRIDRDMAWRDIAIAMSGDANLDDDDVARESARLRKAFERVKAELKRMAEEEGLFGSRS
jgi:RNA polymerase sigma-70 factor (ECF subfamily)